MEITTHTDRYIDIDGTSLQGKIQATIFELEAAFGSPMLSVLDGFEKVSTQWNLMFTLKDGSPVVASLYDWKRTSAQEPDEVISWHIGGLDYRVVDLVHRAFRKAHQIAAAYA